MVINTQEIEIKLPVGYSDAQFKAEIGRNISSADFAFEIIKKSLDARRKGNIYWLIRVLVYDKNAAISIAEQKPKLFVPKTGIGKKAIVVGSGPAGYFCADILLKSGFAVTILERGYDVEKRTKDVAQFEAGGELVINSNYAYGEGGAGTFSDGKLTSRTKDIGVERQYVFDTFVKAGGPEEIKYLAMPHLGSDNLLVMVKNMRQDFITRGGQILFGHQVDDMVVENRQVKSVRANNNEFVADQFVFAIGHSAYDTYELLNNKGVQIESKPFAIGVRVEHEQGLINLNQWGIKALPGLKAAEYRLTCSPSGLPSAYSFCMCPGGKIIPATSRSGLSIVNGVSNYQRNSPFANSAIVSALDLESLLGKKLSFAEIKEYMENLESICYKINNNYAAPANRIKDFILGAVSKELPKSSYPLGIFPYDFAKLLPESVIRSLRLAMMDFSNKIRGFETGIMIGIEATTSSPLRITREESRRCIGFNNLYAVGEGSGYSGGIISSASDGILTALAIAKSV
ncbi:MAG: FAD-dependent oxidoreductase [bacterium]